MDVEDGGSYVNELSECFSVWANFGKISVYNIDGVVVCDVSVHYLYDLVAMFVYGGDVSRVDIEEFLSCL